MSTKTVTCYANAKISTDVSKFGGASGYLDGNSFFYTSSSSDYAFGSGDFTIEAWINITSIVSRFAIFGQTNDSNNNWITLEVLSNRLSFSCGVNNSNIVNLSSVELAWNTGTWYHIAVVKHSSTITLYRNGTPISIDTSFWYKAYNGANFPQISNELHVGAMGTDRKFNGYIDEFRISKGIARWTEAFTPPASAYHSDVYSALLLHFDGQSGSTIIKDSSVETTYKFAGLAVYTIPFCGIVIGSSISWTESKPDGASVAVSVSTDGSNYSPVTNGGQFLPPGSYDNATAYIKIELSTTDAMLTPTVSSLHFALQTVEDTYSIILEMEPLQRFESAVDQITVAYDGGGTLVGEGGAVLAFTQSFAPTDLVPKPHQNDVEHIEISSIVPTGTLTKINYTSTAAQDQGHVEIVGVTVTGTLTNVNNI